MIWIYKFLGADIGHSVALDNVIIDIPSMVKIGDCTSIGYATRLSSSEMRGDYLFVGAITIGKQCRTEPRSVFLPGSCLPDQCHVQAWSCVTGFTNAKPGQMLHGSPAEPTTGERSSQTGHVPLVMFRAWFSIIQMVSMYVLAIISFAGVGISVTIGISVFSGLDNPNAMLLYFVTCTIPVAFVIALVLIVMVKRMILNPKDNIHYTGAFFLLRLWIVDTLLLSPVFNLALVYLLPPSLYHILLRLMGGKAGKEIFWNAPILRSGMEVRTF